MLIFMCVHASPYTICIQDIYIDIYIYMYIYMYIYGVYKSNRSYMYIYIMLLFDYLFHNCDLDRY